MKIDSALTIFSERYDREAIASIEELSKDIGLIQQGAKIKAFNIQEGFNTFMDAITGYGLYKTENVNNEEASPQEKIVEHVNSFITGLFNETTENGEPVEILIKDIPLFVEAYLTNIPKVIETVDKVKEHLLEAGIDEEYIGDINNFVDNFMVRLHESFDPTMDKILWASGYNAKVGLRNAVPNKKEIPVFV